MKQYKDLDSVQKELFCRIESIWTHYKLANVKDFIAVLGVLINKYKRLIK